MKDWSYEKAEKLFVGYLGGKLIDLDKHGFSRTFQFTAEGIDYKVVWFKNQSTLHKDGLQVMFHHADVSNTWPSPSGSKNKLQMYDYSNNCVSVIVLERF